MQTVIALGHAGMGHGDAELGRKILSTLLRKSPAFNQLTAIVLFNDAVKLVAEGSPIVAELHHLHENGVDIKPCGTCLEYYGLTDKVVVGAASNMDEIIDELNKAEKVITL